MRTLALSISLACLLLSIPSVHAAGWEETVSAYRQQADVPAKSIVVPTVLSMSLGTVARDIRGFLVLDVTSNALTSSLLLEESVITPLQVSAEGDRVQAMMDGESRTFASFPLPEEGQGTAHITVRAAKPVTSSSLSFLLDTYVALPTTIEIRADDVVVVARKRMDSASIHFPRTTATTWEVSLTYSQPLRISEMYVAQEYDGRTPERSLRFLAQPKHSYRVYLDQDRPVEVDLPESGNLSDDDGVVAVGAPVIGANPLYTVSDIDGDRVPDFRDNCVEVRNDDQEDVDGNQRGDVCDDFDKDGRINANDNCTDIPNVHQQDTDEDGIGDACDTEESRITERMAWLPWAGMGLAAMVLVCLTVVTVKRGKGQVNGS